MWREIILLIIFWETSNASIEWNILKINDSKYEDSSERLRRHARELVEMCFVNNSNPMVISEDLLDNNWTFGGNPLIVIDRKFDKQITGFLPTYPTYALAFESIDKLKVDINNLQRSTFWNIKSPFLIVETDSRCLDTKTTLKFMWKLNLLAVYHLCEQKNSTVVFTLNPFASYAPAPWELIDEFGDDDDKKMTLYRLECTKDPEVCKSISFDKTDHLENAEVKTSRFTYRKEIFKNKTLKRQYENRLINHDLEMKSMRMHRLFFLMNATSTIDFIPNVKMSELLKQGYVKELADELYDIHDHLLPIEATEYKYVDLIAHYHEITYSILTKKTNFLTVFSDVTNDVQFVVGTVVLFIMFTITMFLINSKDLCLAIIDIVKLVVSMALETPLNRLVMKFILFFGFLFAFLIVPDFQGHVSAILSKPLGRNVETLKDLFNNKFHVHYHDRLENDIINEQMWVTDEDKKYLYSKPTSKMKDCVDAVSQNSTLACIYVTKTLMEEASKLENLYVSKKVVFKKLMVYWARKNWPLKNKLDEMALVTSESGLNTHLNIDIDTKMILKKLTIKKRQEESEKHQQFDFDDLIFNYYFSGYLITSGLIIFMIEMLLARYLRIYRQFQVRRLF